MSLLIWRSIISQSDERTRSNQVQHQHRLGRIYALLHLSPIQYY